MECWVGLAGDNRMFRWCNGIYRKVGKKKFWSLDILEGSNNNFRKLGILEDVMLDIKKLKFRYSRV